MRTLIFIFLPFLFFSFQTDKIKSEWKKIELPGDWALTISDSTEDYFNFGNSRGQLIFKNKSKAVVYYIYDLSVDERFASGQYSAFFKGKNCQQYSSWKEGGFPNFVFKNKYYLIDLCNTSPYLSDDDEYWDLSQALFDYINN